jgi:hypothetical protein
MQKASLRFALAGLVMVLGALAGCASPGDPIDRVQNNLVDKSIFEGEWWYSRAVIDVQNDALWAMGAAGVSTPWDGVHSNIDLGARAGVMGRIRWVIDENFLYAYRSYEVIQGASQEADDDGFTGEPLAIFPITAHVDVRREFNGLTGEPTNVVSESSDRRWYDRQYLRVDWSTNLVTLGLLHGMDFSSFVNFEREPVSRFTQEGGDGRDGDNYRPEFVRIGDDPDYRFRDEWPDGTEDTVHYMSFVTQEVWTPTNCPRELCSTSVEVSQRHAFLRIPPNHEYAVETLGNSEYDRFGIIRTESRTYIRGGESRNEIRRACNTDADCGGAACIDPVEEGGAEAQVPGTYCVGGLTGEYGETDFVTYYRLRHNLYRDSLTDTECRADWECDNRYGQYLPGQLPDGLGSGSTCDPAALRCTRPIAEREAREVTYHLSPNYPRHLVRTSFEVMAEWNDTFMYGHRRRLGQAAPAVPRMQCQSTDPTTYCYCDDTRDFAALEVAPDGTCEGRSNYFVPPDERGEDIPYDCWIAIVDDEGNPTTETETINPSSPQAFADYPEDVYRYAFVGSECALTLEVNSCDRPVPEGAEPAACENLGDIRYQFFNFVSGAGAGWCGVMQPNQDPLTGEAVISPVNMGGQCLDRVATNAIDLWPVLRGEADEETLFTGENVRGYFERLGNVHYPLGLSPSIEGGDFDPDPGRPAIPLDFAERAAQYIENNAERLQSLGPRRRSPDRRPEPQRGLGADLRPPRQPPGHRPRVPPDRGAPPRGCPDLSPQRAPGLRRRALLRLALGQRLRQPRLGQRHRPAVGRRRVALPRRPHGQHPRGHRAGANLRAELHHDAARGALREPVQPVVGRGLPRPVHRRGPHPLASGLHAQRHAPRDGARPRYGAQLRRQLRPRPLPRRLLQPRHAAGPGRILPERAAADRRVRRRRRRLPHRRRGPGLGPGPA